MCRCATAFKRSLQNSCQRQTALFLDFSHDVKPLMAFKSLDKLVFVSISTMSFPQTWPAEQTARVIRLRGSSPLCARLTRECADLIRREIGSESVAHIRHVMLVTMHGRAVELIIFADAQLRNISRGLRFHSNTLVIRSVF